MHSSGRDVRHDPGARVDTHKLRAPIDRSPTVSHAPLGLKARCRVAPRAGSISCFVVDNTNSGIDNYGAAIVLMISACRAYV